MRTKHGFIALLLVAGFCCADASAKTRLDLDVGWDGSVRVGRWSPVFITLTDPDGPDAFVEVAAPHDIMHGMRVRQFVGTLGPQPKTFVLYLPMNSVYGPYGTPPVSVVVRRADNGKVLARIRDDEPAPLRQFNIVDGQGRFFGVSGRRTGLTTLGSSVPTHRSFWAGHLDQDFLPLTPQGYDAIDALVFAGPDLSRMSDEQQGALVDWIRAGGALLLWPGEDPLPAKSPLLDVLPCRIGGATVIETKLDQLKAAGVPARFAKLPGRELSPLPGSTPVPMLGGAVTGHARSLGLGRIVVMPTDIDALQWNGSALTWAAWKPVLAHLVDVAPLAVAAGSTGYGSFGPEQQRQAIAEQQVADLLGNVPGAGQFGFTYVVVVLVGLMVVVGPVDWLVLRLLGRQAWTWVTTTGWIGLVTLGALYAGHVMKSGDLHYRTLAVVDQAGDRTVGRSDFAGLYAPKTDRYALAVDPAASWEPLALSAQHFRGSMGRDVEFAQTYRGTSPDPMTINVWSLRFLKSHNYGDGPALLDATLSRKPGPKESTRLVGTIRNLTDASMTDVWLKLDAGAMPLSQAIPPRGSVAVDLVFEKPKTPAGPNGAGLQQPQVYDPYYPSNPGQGGAGMQQVGVPGAGAGPVRVGDRIEQLVRGGDHACVVARQAETQPGAALKNAQPIEQHWRVVRAVVPLQKP